MTAVVLPNGDVAQVAESWTYWRVGPSEFRRRNGRIECRGEFESRWREIGELSRSATAVLLYRSLTLKPEPARKEVTL